MKKEWNPDEYQGRSKQQVENQYTAFSIFVGIISIVGIVLTLFTIFNNIF